MKQIQETVETGQEIFEFVVEKMQTENSVHVGTLVSAFARLSGTSLLRSFNIIPDEIEPGTVLLSDQANQEGPQLHGVIINLLEAFGTQLDQSKIVIETPPEFQPVIDLGQTQEQFEHGFTEIVRRNGFDQKEAAFAAAAACAIAIHETRDVVDPHLSFGIAAFGVVEGAKTAPVPLVQNSDNKAE